MQQLAVGGGGRLAARKTHGVKADTDRKHVCVLMGKDACLHVRDCVSVCEIAHVLERLCMHACVCITFFFFAIYLIMTFGMSLENGA